MPELIFQKIYFSFDRGNEQLFQPRLTGVDLQLNFLNFLDQSIIFVFLKYSNIVET